MSTVKKKCQVVMLPTEKAEYPCLIKNDDKPDSTGKLWRRLGKNNYFTQDYLNGIPAKGYHLYIISDDEIKHGDWCYDIIPNPKTGILENIIYEKRKGRQFLDTSSEKKIIATTNPNLLVDRWNRSLKLIRKRLPQPSEEFILKFIESYNKCQKITDILVEYEWLLGETEDENQNLIPELYLKKNAKTNEISISKIKTSWTREEVEMELRTMHINLYGADRIAMHNLNEWIEKNL